MSSRCVLTIFLVCLPGLAQADERTDNLVRDLTNLVRDRLAPTWQRVEAVNTLGKLGPTAAPAIGDLTAQLHKLRGADTAPLQEAIVRTLAQIGSASRVAIPTMTLALGRDFDLDQAIRKSTNQILATGDDDVTTLITMLKTRDEPQRLRAAKALAKLGPIAKIAIPELTVALSDPDSDVRRTALSALKAIQGKISAAEAGGVYILDLQNPDEDIRYLAAKNIGRLGREGAPALTALQPLLTDPSLDVRRAAAEAITKISQ